MVIVSDPMEDTWEIDVSNENFMYIPNQKHTTLSVFVLIHNYLILAF